MTDATIKGPSAFPTYDGTPLRVAIVHARWNAKVIDSLVKGAVSTLKSLGVKESNIHIESVAGSWELPFAVKGVYQASQIAATATGGVGGSGADLLGGMVSPEPVSEDSSAGKQPFDVIIPIGVLIKGHTSHYEYISEAVSRQLMELQFQLNVPIVFGLLTCLTEEQALLRAGIGGAGNEGHNHGDDWGKAAVEMGVRWRGWNVGTLGKQ